MELVFEDYNNLPNEEFNFATQIARILRPSKCTQLTHVLEFFQRVISCLNIKLRREETDFYLGGYHLLILSVNRGVLT